uniref:Uncharacterized protein n=1 Tax=Arundo donax TaxID=35708 RepID=A0A0A9GZ24_ARUDO
MITGPYPFLLGQDVSVQVSIFFLFLFLPILLRYVSAAYLPRIGIGHGIGCGYGTKVKYPCFIAQETNSMQGTYLRLEMFIILT